MARRISVPITMTSIAVALVLSLAVTWQILVAREFRALAEGFTAIHWVLLVVGSLFFLLILTAAILQTVWLVREMATNQRQRNFLDAVTHELHTPLTSLQLYLETLQSQALDESERREFLSIMSEDLVRLHSTIDQLLRAAQTEVRARREPVDLAKLLRGCAEEARARHDLAADSIRLDVPEPAEVRGDFEQLRVAFRNLLENAIRYAGKKVQVDVRVRAASRRTVEVEVEDQGIGIDPSALRRVFQRFQRLSSEPGRAVRGLGLGLFVVRNVVRAHGGRIRAESEGTGRGSRFIITLPGRVDGSANPAH